MRIDHFQLAIPAGSEDLCRPFWLAPGFVEADKPAGLADRGGLWLRCSSADLQLGVGPAFSPTTKAHPGLAVASPDPLAEALQDFGAPVLWDNANAGHRRFFTAEPVGNLIELLED
jgi:hypothetical protein